VTGGRWLELGDGVLVRRYAELDLSVGLVVGADACLVVDTRGDRAQGAELAAAVRAVTPHPWRVVLTHAHFDHCFGTGAFLPGEVWAHEGCLAGIAAAWSRQRAAWAAHYRAEGRADIAAEIAATDPVRPTRTFTDRAELSVGGRRVLLRHVGPAHTDHDAVVLVPDANVAFVGDLAEHPEFVPSSFEDCHLAGWPAALDRVLALGASVLVPGHGEPVDPSFVAGQRDTLATLADLGRAVSAGELTTEDAVRRAPLDAEAARAALARLPA